MNRINLYLFFILMISANTVYAQFGAKGGLNLSKMESYGNLEEGEREGFKAGFQGGMFYKFNVSDMFNLMIELNYERRGTVSKKEYSIEDINPITGLVEFQINQEANSTYTYVNLPILALFGEGNLKGYIGPNIGYLVSGKADFKRTVEASSAGNIIDSEQTDLKLDWQDYNSFRNILPSSSEEDGFLNSLDFGINLGAMYYLGGGFIVDLRVSQCLADVTNNHYDYSLYPKDDNTTFPSREDTDRNLSIQLGLGYFF